ncbi:MAG: ComEC family competence protein [Cyclobacteriaceae bacterium]|nr:ComEC family competence protein [Cyclobacteriaceae bacterium]
MFRWAPIAMVRITTFLVAGILAAIYFPNQLSTVIITAIIISLFSIYILLAILSRKVRHSLLPGFVGLCAISFVGYQLVTIRTDLNNPLHFMYAADTIHYYTAIVRSVPVEKAKSWKVEMEVRAIRTDQWKKSEGKVLLYMAKDSVPLSWKFGDQILIKGSPVLLSSPANPEEFDYKRFLSFKNIYHQQYVRPFQIRWIAGAERSGFIFYSHQVRHWASDQIAKYIHDPQAQGIASALVLGVTDGLDSDLLNAYAASGAMHVLAVSGLHVGIIYALLLFLLKPFAKFRGSVWLTAGLSLLCLWGFAFVTGLSPSVLRAVTMFSFVALAKPFAQRTNIYNTLAASAFALLLYNPYLIMSVGFQLSYLAVLGIVYLQRPIYNLWEVKSRIGDWVWQITCVSLAAQIATFSLGLLYFHQFPVYFLVSNLFVIPLSTAVLVLGIILLCISSISMVATLLGKLLSVMIYLLNQTVFVTEKLPFSLISDIYITTFQCCLLMGVLIGILLIFERKNLYGLYLSIACGIVFSIMQWMHYASVERERQWIVYAVSGHTAMDFISNQQAQFIADSALLNDFEKIRFHIRPNRLIHGVSKVQSDTVLSSRKVNDITFELWQQHLIAHAIQPAAHLPANATVDYLLVSRNALDVTKIRKEQVGMLILDASNTRNYCNKLIKFAKQNQIPIHSVLHQGAFILTESK